MSGGDTRTTRKTLPDLAYPVSKHAQTRQRMADEHAISGATLTLWALSVIKTALKKRGGGGGGIQKEIKEGGTDEGREGESEGGREKGREKGRERYRGRD